MTNPLSSTLRGRARAAAVGPGTEFWMTKTVVSSTIPTASPVDITGVSTGRLAILDVYLKTGPTGLAGGTALQLICNNANGQPVILQTVISGLGANKTLNLSDASVTKIKTILESGKKLQLQATVADCTGAGTIEVCVRFQRLDEDAFIEATE